MEPPKLPLPEQDDVGTAINVVPDTVERVAARKPRSEKQLQKQEREKEAAKELTTLVGKPMPSTAAAKYLRLKAENDDAALQSYLAELTSKGWKTTRKGKRIEGNEKKLEIKEAEMPVEIKEAATPLEKEEGEGLSDVEISVLSDAIRILEKIVRTKNKTKKTKQRRQDKEIANTKSK